MATVPSINGNLVAGFAAVGGVGAGASKLYRELKNRRETGESIRTLAVLMHTLSGAAAGATVGWLGQLRYGTAQEGLPPPSTFERIEDFGRKLIGKPAKSRPPLETIDLVPSSAGSEAVGGGVGLVPRQTPAPSPAGTPPVGHAPEPLSPTSVPTASQPPETFHLIRAGIAEHMAPFRGNTTPPRSAIPPRLLPEIQESLQWLGEQGKSDAATNMMVRCLRAAFPQLAEEQIRPFFEGSNLLSLAQHIGKLPREEIDSAIRILRGPFQNLSPEARLQACAKNRAFFAFCAMDTDLGEVTRKIARSIHWF